MRLGLGKKQPRMAPEEALSKIFQVPAGCLTPLAYCSKVNIADSPPQGCAIVTVNDKVRSFILKVAFLR